MLEETFIKLLGYNDTFYVSNYGRVYDVVHKKFLTPYKLNNGRMAVDIGINGRKYMYQVDKLVVNTWFFMPFEFVGKKMLDIEHKDGDLTNNCADNLKPLYNVDSVKDGEKGKTAEEQQTSEEELFNKYAEWFKNKLTDEKQCNKARPSEIAKRALEKQKSSKVK